MTHNLSRYLENEVEIKQTLKGNGKIIIPYNSENNLIQIMELLIQKSWKIYSIY